MSQTNNNKPGNDDILKQLAADNGSLFKVANYANRNATKVEAAVRVNADGCGWSSIPAKAIALILMNQDQALAAIKAAVAEKNDPAKVAAILEAKRNKDSGKSNSGNASTGLDDLVKALG